MEFGPNGPFPGQFLTRVLLESPCTKPSMLSNCEDLCFGLFPTSCVRFKVWWYKWGSVIYVIDTCICKWWYFLSSVLTTACVFGLCFLLTDPEEDEATPQSQRRWEIASDGTLPHHTRTGKDWPSPQICNPMHPYLPQSASHSQLVFTFV